MNTLDFHRQLKDNGILFEVEGDKTVITCNYGFYLNIRTIPDNVTFKNNGYVEFYYLEEIPANTIFQNKGDVFLSDKVKIPAKFKGFQNKGNINPEQLHLKLPLIRLTYSEEFSYFLEDNVNNKLCYKIREKNNCYLEGDLQFSFIIPIEGDEIGFLPLSKIYKLYVKHKKENPDKSKNIGNWLNNQRSFLFKEAYKNRLKIGRFVKKLFPDTPDVEIEEFVNCYKSALDTSRYEMELVKGEDIRKYYDRANQDAPENSNLYRSCYNYTTKEDVHPNNGLNLFKQLEFYVKNPNLGMLLLREKGAEKICGRALIWFDKNGKKLIDHVYTKLQSEQYLYKKYAIENNCLNYNSGDSYKDIVVEVPEELQHLEVIPAYLDCLKYFKEKNLIKGNHYED